MKNYVSSFKVIAIIANRIKKDKHMKGQNGESDILIHISSSINNVDNFC